MQAKLLGEFMSLEGLIFFFFSEPSFKLLLPVFAVESSGFLKHSHSIFYYPKYTGK